MKTHVLKTLLLFVAFSLSACGFALRQTPDFAFTTLYNAAGDGSALMAKLRNALESGSKVRVITDVGQMNRAQVIFETLLAQREKAVMALTATGQVREFVLRIHFTFRLRTPQGLELIPKSEIVLERSISYSESAALSKETEESMLYNDMEKDLVVQVMRRLAAVKSLDRPVRP